MASIHGLTKKQNAALANVRVGSLILLYHPCHPESESDSESEDDQDDEDDEDDEDDDEDDEDDEGDEDDGEGVDEYYDGEGVDFGPIGSGRPTTASVSTTTNDLLDVDRAEHIEDASLAPAASGSNGVRSKAPSPLLVVARNVSMVTQIIKDLSGNITDIHILGLEYKVRPDDNTRSYQLYGNQCVANLPSGPVKPASGFAAGHESKLYTRGIRLSLFQNLSEMSFGVAPTGDLVRQYLHRGVCPAGCDQGSLASIHELNGMVKDYTVASLYPDMSAICPACVGVDLMKEHQALRAELENTLQISNFSTLLDFYGRLAPRRAQLGYEYEQFDERQWNLLFDDMASEDEGEGPDGGYEPWDEANDPNGDVVPRPTPQATIDSLPTIKYATVKADDDALCIVCCEQFKDEQLVVKLPCKHIFCEGACILEWLKNNDSCPLCRAQVSSEDDVKAADSANEQQELPDAVEEPEKEQEHPEDHTSMPGFYGNW